MQVLVEVADAGLGVVGVLLCEACLSCLSYAVCSCYHLSGFILGPGNWDQHLGMRLCHGRICIFL